MSKSTFRILFYLRKNYLNKSGKAGIMIRLTVNGDMVQFSSKLDIEPSLWDTKAGKAAGNSVCCLTSYPRNALRTFSAGTNESRDSTYR